MTGILIVGLVAVVALMDLFRLRATNTTLSRAGVLVAAMPRALMPLAAAAALGAWTLINRYEAIARTGSGGLGTVVAATGRALETLLAGVLAFLLLLGIALVIAARTRERAVVEPDRQSVSGRRGAAAAGILIIAAAVVSGWMAMDWTDKVGVGMLGPMTRNIDLPQIPTTYRSYGYASGREAAEQSEWLITSRRVGGLVCGVAVVLCFLTSFLFSRVWFSSTAWHVARVSAVTLIAGAALYSAHLWTGAAWLRALMRG